MGDVLFLAHRMPFPPDRGDRIRAFNILKHLAKTRRVHFAGFVDSPEDIAHQAGLEPYTVGRTVVVRTKRRPVALAEALLHRRPVSLTAFDSAAMRAGIANILAREAIDTIYVYSGQMAQYLPEDRDARVVMDFCDVDSAKFDAYADQALGPMRWITRREGRMLADFERQVAARADASLFITEAEAALFRQRGGAGTICVVENGIDLAVFDAEADFAPVPGDGPLVVFTGQMDYRPNIEAATWFAHESWPIVRARFPDARFAIVGRAPTDAVRALGRIAGVEVTGEVPDVRGWVAAAACVVAPLKLARGVQNKVLEAMAMARAVVASAAAAEGIAHAGTIRVADTVEALAQDVIALLADPAGAAALGRRARAQVEARYGWDARLAALDPLMTTGAASATRALEGV